MSRHDAEDLYAGAFASLRDLVLENSGHPEIKEIESKIAGEIRWIRETTLALIELWKKGHVASFIMAEHLFQGDRAEDHSCVLIMMGARLKWSQAAADVRGQMLEMLRIGVAFRKALYDLGSSHQTWS